MPGSRTVGITAKPTATNIAPASTNGVARKWISSFMRRRHAPPWTKIMTGAADVAAVAQPLAYGGARRRMTRQIVLSRRRPRALIVRAVELGLGVVEEDFRVRHSRGLHGEDTITADASDPDRRRRHRRALAGA